MNFRITSDVAFIIFYEKMYSYKGNSKKTLNCGSKNVNKNQINTIISGEPISEELDKRWRSFRNYLKLISNLKISPILLVADFLKNKIYTFRGVFEKANFAVIYVCLYSHSEKMTVNISTSKIKVVLIKIQLIPRRELCSALLLVNSLKMVLNGLIFKESEEFVRIDCICVAFFRAS